MIAVLGVGGILLFLTGAGSALLGWPKVEGARSRQIKKSAPQIKSGWDYRARKAIRPHGDANGAGAETSEVRNSERCAINNNVRLNNGSLERGAYTLMNLEPKVEDTTTKALLSNHENAVSAYDQSPIDDPATGAE